MRPTKADRLMLGIALCLAALAGCGASAPDTPMSPAPPAVRVAEPAVMAIVDGEPIYMDTLHELLVHARGLEVAQELIANKLVNREAARRGVTATEADVEAATQQALDTMLPNAASRDQQERVLTGILAQRGVPRQLWRLRMKRDALLAKMAEPDLTPVTAEQIKAAFGDTYGRRVQVRHIQTASPQEAQEVLRALRNGEDFAELARMASKHPLTARNGGLLPWIGTDGPESVSPVIRQAAMAMSQTGELSDPIQAGTAFHVLKLQRVRDPQNVELEQVRHQLAEQVRRQQLERRGRQILENLLESAQMAGKIQIVNPILKTRYR